MLRYEKLQSATYDSHLTECPEYTCALPLLLTYRNLAFGFILNEIKIDDYEHDFSYPFSSFTRPSLGHFEAVFIYINWGQ